MNLSSRAKPIKLGILGASGLVGQQMLRLVMQRRWPLGELRLIASAKHAGQPWEVEGQRGVYLEASGQAFRGLDLLLSSAGGQVSLKWLPEVASAGVLAIDNTSAYREDPGCPLVVPEVNAHELDSMELGQGGIIANPNCSTIQLVVVLAPLLREFGLAQVVVSTYQSLSGAGTDALDAFEDGTRRAMAGETRDLPASVLDVLPQIGALDEAGHSEEERKMMTESSRILGTEISLDVTCVRVPVRRGHGESVWIETREEASLAQVLDLLRSAPGICLAEGEDHPTQAGTAGDLDVHVGRVRGVSGSRKRFQLWIVTDNLLKGAAWNAVQIAESLFSRG